MMPTRFECPSRTTTGSVRGTVRPPSGICHTWKEQTVQSNGTVHTCASFSPISITPQAQPPLLPNSIQHQLEFILENPILIIMPCIVLSTSYYIKPKNSTSHFKSKKKKNTQKTNTSPKLNPALGIYTMAPPTLQLSTSVKWRTVARASKRLLVLFYLREIFTYALFCIIYSAFAE